MKAEYDRNYRRLNKNRISAYADKWRKTHRRKCVEYTQRYQAKLRAKGIKKPISTKVRAYIKHWVKANPHRLKAYRQKWLQGSNGRQWMRDYEQHKRSSDLDFRIAANLRCRLRSVLRGKAKTSSVLVLLGCSVESFRTYIESKFEPEMTWSNYGTFWEIDHIVPCAIFDFSRPEHQAACFHFSNLQPLTVTANRRKWKTHLNTPTEQQALA